MRSGQTDDSSDKVQWIHIVAEALADLADADRRAARALICGSLYLAGAVLRDFAGAR